MRKPVYFLSGFSILLITVYLFACNSSTDKSDTGRATTEAKPLSQDELIKKGDYIVSTGACNDCHSPKVMTQMGPVPDSTKLLSGHPASGPLPPLDANFRQTWRMDLYEP